MPSSPKATVKFRRNRFLARFPEGYLYSPAHFWLDETEPGRWRIGLTTFATRMLGEIVELDFEVPEGDSVQVGQVVGWMEGFKATTDLFCVAEGRFGGANTAVFEDAELVCSDPYGEGWLYWIEGSPDPQAMAIEGYLEMLGETIDAMEDKPWQQPEIDSRAPGRVT